MNCFIVVVHSLGFYFAVEIKMKKQLGEGGNASMVQSGRLRLDDTTSERTQTKYEAVHGLPIYLVRVVQSPVSFCAAI